jgi:hypothetical protein
VSLKGFITIAAVWSLVFSPIVGQAAPMNPYQSPEGSVDTEHVLDRLERIAIEGEDTETQVRQVEHFLQSTVPFWKPFTRVTTLPYEASPFDHLRWNALPNTLNRGKTVAHIDALAKSLNRERLMNLPIQVVAPLLALCDFTTLKEFRNGIPEDQRQSPWAQAITYAQIHKAGLISDTSRQGFMSLNTKMAIGGLVGAFFMSTKGVFLLGDIKDPALFQAAVIGVVIGALSYWAAFYASKFYDANNRTGMLDKAIAQAELQAALDWANANSHIGPQLMKNEGWGTKPLERAKCVAVMRLIAEQFSPRPNPPTD